MRSQTAAWIEADILPDANGGDTLRELEGRRRERREKRDAQPEQHVALCAGNGRVEYLARDPA